MAVAATLADLRVGTWVYSSPLRMPWSMAWEAHPLSVLTEGQFEMGIGTGRPGSRTNVVMAVRGPKAQALAADLAETVAFAAMPGDSRAEMMRLAAGFRAIRDVELALHVPVVGDASPRS